jgi:glycosyltransferase involved in cell wall biosynthesis
MRPTRTDVASAQMRIDVPVSVVITAYNSERFVADAIRTVQGQSVRPREIILVDDGSIDRTAEIAAEFGVTVLTRRNGGSAAARNTGTQAASAPWIAYLDVDDLWAPEKLELQWEALQSAPEAGFSFCDFAVFTEAGIIKSGHLASCAEYAAVVRRPLGDAGVYAGRASLGLQLLGADFISMSSLLVRRELIFAIGGFDESMRRSEDYEFMLRLLAVADAAIIEQRTVFYRLHSANKSAHWYQSLLAKNEIAECIAKNPHNYPPGACAHFASQRLPNINAAAKALLRSQRYREAREVAFSGVREQLSWRGIATILLSLALGFPPASALHSALRRLKQSLARPMPRTALWAAAELDLSRALPTTDLTCRSHA